MTTPHDWATKPIALRMMAAGTINDSPQAIGDLMGLHCATYSVLGRSAEELMIKVIANAAIVIASTEYPTDETAKIDRYMELTKRFSAKE